jgi:RNA polymerase sigma factor (sigma-70 family)
MVSVSAEAHAAPSDPGDDRHDRLAGYLVAARAGDRGALHAIVAELTPLLWQVARVTGLNQATCEDVVQTTWLQLLRDLDRIRDPRALTGWLVTVARREALRVASAAARERPVLTETLDQAGSATADTAEMVVRDERARTLWATLEQLPQRCRDLLRLVAFVERPDYDHVAVTLGMPRGSIGPTRGRCLAKLRETLTAQPDWSWQ